MKKILSLFVAALALNALCGVQVTKQYCDHNAEKGVRIASNFIEHVTMPTYVTNTIYNIYKDDGTSMFVVSPDNKQALSGDLGIYNVAMVNDITRVGSYDTFTLILDETTGLHYEPMSSYLSSSHYYFRYRCVENPQTTTGSGTSLRYKAGLNLIKYNGNYYCILYDDAGTSLGQSQNVPLSDFENHLTRLEIASHRIRIALSKYSMTHSGEFVAKSNDVETVKTNLNDLAYTVKTNLEDIISKIGKFGGELEFTKISGDFIFGLFPTNSSAIYRWEWGYDGSQASGQFTDLMFNRYDSDIDGTYALFTPVPGAYKQLSEAYGYKYAYKAIMRIYKNYKGREGFTAIVQVVNACMTTPPDNELNFTEVSSSSVRPHPPLANLRRLYCDIDNVALTNTSDIVANINIPIGSQSQPPQYRMMKRIAFGSYFIYDKVMRESVFNKKIDELRQWAIDTFVPKE